MRDPSRFGVIFERYFDRVFAYATRRAGTDAAEEIASEVFIQAFTHRRRFDPAWGGAGPWLFGIATNVLRHHHRAERTRLEAYARSAAIVQPQTAASPEEIHEATAALPAVANALRQLEPRDRDAFLLFAWADLSYQQVAQALEIPVGTVRSRINRARKQLRELSGLPEATTGRGREERP